MIKGLGKVAIDHHALQAEFAEIYRLREDARPEALAKLESKYPKAEVNRGFRTYVFLKREQESERAVFQQLEASRARLQRLDVLLSQTSSAAVATRSEAQDASLLRLSPQFKNHEELYGGRTDAVLAMSTLPGSAAVIDSSAGAHEDSAIVKPKR